MNFSFGFVSLLALSVSYLTFAYQVYEKDPDGYNEIDSNTAHAGKPNEASVDSPSCNR